jgi:steroid delta-isomerase-like uncharacterized protein
VATVPDTRAVATSYFDRLINDHDLGFIPALFDPRIAFHDPAIIPGGEVHGHDGVQGFFSTFFHVFPDVRFTIDDLFVEGEKAAIRFTWTGTHQARFLGIDITERHVTVPGIDIFDVVDGRIAEVRVAFDRLELIEQLVGVTHPI